MGLKVTGSLVEVDEGHNQYLNTGPSGNPVIDRHDSGMVIYSVFRRNRAPKSAKGQHKGDNCPLLYALKRKNGMHTNLSSIKKMVPAFYGIVRNHINHGYDLIVPMPSNHSLCRILSRRLVRIYGCQAAYDFFSKVSIEDAEAQLQGDNTLSYPDRKQIKFALKDQARIGATNFSLKDIATKSRYVFDPVKVNREIVGEDFKRILLVDDLVSSGRTLECARSHIVARFPSAQVEALCLFSKSNR